MRRTRLMELTSKYGNRDLAIDTSTIDTVVYMLCEMAETEFGPRFIDSVAPYIQLTQTNYNRKKALEFLVNRLIHEHLAPSFAELGNKEVARDLGELEPLSERTYVDYFVRLTKMERHVHGTSIEKACSDLPQMLAGYTTENPFPVCQAVVNFFGKTNDPQSLLEMIRDLCQQIKANHAEWSA